MGNDLLVTSMSLHTRARNILYNLNWKTINDSWVAMETILQILVVVKLQHMLPFNIQVSENCTLKKNMLTPVLPKSLVITT